ncbi:MAG: Spy/CpxP family protein refolding chaperone [Pseudomonadales bacterium]|nr:Spy/CpxP family protein refolding chaperone [Pseudomonadales bacterium]
MFFLASFAYAGGHQDDHQKGHKNGCQQGHHAKLSDKRIEKMQKKLDLNEQQVSELKVIAKQYPADKKHSRKQAFKGFQQLDPNGKNYQQKLTAFADQRAAEVKAKILRHGNMRADIYKVLTSDQQQKMQQWMKKKHKNKAGK